MVKTKRFPDPAAKGDYAPFWDRDPAIKAMRQVFKKLEKWEERKMRKLHREHISSWDPKLRRVHERTVRLHTRAMNHLIRQGIPWTHELYEKLFTALFDHAMSENGIYAGVPFHKSRFEYKDELDEFLFRRSGRGSPAS